MYFAVGFGGYRAKVLLKNFNAGEVPGSDPKLVAAFLNRLDFLFNALYILGGIAAVVFVVALIPWIGPHWRSRATRALAWLAGGSVIAALAVGFASLWANMSASLLIERNLNYFEDVLHEFGIREAAEGRFRDFSERVRRQRSIRDENRIATLGNAKGCTPEANPLAVGVAQRTSAADTSESRPGDAFGPRIHRPGIGFKPPLADRR